MPSCIAVTPTASIAITIAAVTATIEVPCGDLFSPWDGDNVLPEVLEVPKRLATPYRGVGVVSAITARGEKGELTLLSSHGPFDFLYGSFLLSYYCSNI